MGSNKISHDACIVWHDILTAMEAADVLRIGRSKMYKLINDGAIRHVKLDRKILIPRICLQEFIERNTIMCYNEQVKMDPSCCGKGENS